ncbi:MAG: hypothetical protein ABWY35_13835 [Pseudorhodoplanes sp.]
MIFPNIRLASCRIMICLPFIGCINTDFGRVRPTLRSDDMHSWMGPAVNNHYGEPASAFRLTEDEKMMRDLGFPLIAPRYDLNRWYSVLIEYGLGGPFQPNWWVYDPTTYAQVMFQEPTRSTETYYNRLIDDIRNDIVRIPPFATVARRVTDMDHKREKSLHYIGNLTPVERGNATARMMENSLIARWVHQSLMERGYAYRYALERLVISSPSSQAAEAERQLNLMAMRISEATLVPPGSNGPWVAGANSAAVWGGKGMIRVSK